MKKFFVSIGLALTMLITGCGQEVSINPGEVGAEVDNNSRSPWKSESRFKMDWCPVGACPRLDKIQVADIVYNVPGSYHISASGMDIAFEMTVIGGIKPDYYDRIYNDVRPHIVNNHTTVITSEAIATRYLSGMRTVIRNALNEDVDADGNRVVLKVEDILDNLPETHNRINKAIAAYMSNTPITFVKSDITKFNWPEKIKENKESLAGLSIEKERKLEEFATLLETKAAEKKLEIADARNAIAVDKIIADAWSPSMAEFRLIRAIQTCAENENGCVMNFNPNTFIK